METSEVQIKKKKRQYFILQLINASFCEKIKIYNDPFSAKTTMIEFKGVTLAGGLDKSYYIKKKGEAIARKIRKKEYKKDIAKLFSEWPHVVSKYSDFPRWNEFEIFIFDYSTICN